MSTLELTVDGMHCGGCSGRLKKALEQTGGVRSAHIVLDTKRVTVDFDAAAIDEDAIRQAVHDTGFTVSS